jgi:hypothetical protein
MVMTGQLQTTEILRFFCPSCRAELTVPVTLAGIEGPCPSCFEPIRAPVAEAIYLAGTETDDMELELPPLPPSPRPPFPGFPNARLRAGCPPAEPRRSEFPDPAFGEPTAKNFKARLAIPAQDEPLDESWRGRVRDQRRSDHRARRVEKAAQGFLDSRGFKVARGVLILLSGAMLAWLFHYLRTHQWQLPGMSHPLAEEAESRPAPKTTPALSAGGSANDLTNDDDAEFPRGTIRNPGPSAPRMAPGAAVAGQIPD